MTSGSIRVFVVYIDTGSPVPNIPSRSRGLADENKKKFWRKGNDLKQTYCSRCCVILVEYIIYFGIESYTVYRLLLPCHVVFVQCQDRINGTFSALQCNSLDIFSLQYFGLFVFKSTISFNLTCCKMSCEIICIFYYAHVPLYFIINIFSWKGSTLYLIFCHINSITVVS